MRLRVTHWIATTLRRRRTVTTTMALAAPPPTGPPPDHERVVQVGDALQSCYAEKDETLDDNLTALMLRLSVEPVDPPEPRKP
jgi:hypothetical protein